MVKKIMVVLLVCLSCSAFLFGCSRFSSGGKSSKVSSSNITFVSHFDPGFSEDWPITRTKKAFEDKYSGKVDIKIYASDIYTTKIMSMIAADSSPEIIQVASEWMPTFAIQNILQPVDGLIEIDKLPFQSFVQSMKWKEKSYTGYVNGVWAPLIWYNKSKFEIYGVTTPGDLYAQNNWTWDTFLNCAKQMTDKDMWGFSTVNVEEFVHSLGKGFTKLNSDGTVDITWKDKDVQEALQFTSDLFMKYKVWNPDLGYAANNFKKGKIAMSTGAIDFVKSYCKDMTDVVDCVPIPVQKKGNTYQMVGYGLFYGIGYNTKNLDGAVNFLKILATESKIDIDQNKLTPAEKFLTKEQVEIARKVSDRANIIYDYSFTDWRSQYMYTFWNSITLGNTPVATALATYEPILKKSITDTLASFNRKITPYNGVSNLTYETNSLDWLTTDGLVKSATTASVELTKGNEKIEGNGSLLLNAGAGDDWPMLVMSDINKAKFPSGHKYKITFDYKVIKADKDAKMYVTFRSKSTIASDLNQWGWIEFGGIDGDTGKCEGTVIINGTMDDACLLLLGNGKSTSISIDNLSVVES